MKLNAKEFRDLSLEQLYQILQLRFKVFIVEQQSIYNEYDKKDLDSVHLFYTDEDDIVAYLRFYLKDKTTAGIGRVAVDKNYRGQGLGREIVSAGIRYVKTNWEVRIIRIEAQEHLRNFYQGFGFKPVSDVYDDCGVPHLDMVIEF